MFDISSFNEHLMQNKNEFFDFGKCVPLINHGFMKDDSVSMWFEDMGVELYRSRYSVHTGGGRLVIEIDTNERSDDSLYVALTGCYYLEYGTVVDILHGPVPDLMEIENATQLITGIFGFYHNGQSPVFQGGIDIAEAPPYDGPLDENAPVTPQTVKRACEENSITRINHHECGACLEQVTYEISFDGAVAFYGNCNYPGPHAFTRMSSWGEIAEFINMQSNEEVRNRLKRSVGFTIPE